MATSLKQQPLERRPVYRNIHIKQLTSYRLPAAGWVSILHRISGAAMFLLLPFAIWLFDASVTSEASYQEFASVFSAGAAGWVSILHRISGAAMFLLLPFAIWLFDASVTSEASYQQFASVFAAGAAGFPGWIWKLVVFALIWAYLLHFCAGLRHVWMDATHEVGLAFGRVSALVAIVLSTVVALALGAKLFF